MGTILSTLRAWLPGLVALLLLQSDISHADRADARALVESGLKLENAGSPQQALSRYERGIKSDPGYLPSYQHAIPLWFRLNRLKTAEGMLEGLTLRCDNCVFAWYALGAVYRKQQRFDLAIMVYEIYLGKRPDDPDAYFGLAMALGRAGQHVRAAVALQEYLELEKRPDRAAYRRQAIRLLAQMQEGVVYRSPPTRAYEFVAWLMRPLLPALAASTQQAVR